MGTEPSGEDAPRRDEWDDVVLDESFVRGAEVREPTARTRMLQERWKDGGPAPQPWRSEEPPAGWIYGSGGRRQRSGGQRKRRWFRRKGKDGSGE
ncbi:SGM_3592 family protein [Streptomyces litchfieldiae]|uniref:Uncharacterized protein n=1 Tax=Streptomyces litchfieldiae TaxID=3075543 RepID=A0ABU2MZM0_9ACTN|nr:hypothetical protein [Streptomyces sp. DSM 44938]MDT0347103.1 hypothetical protein [Streptomyces sp. DSM 44938]